MNSLKDKLNRLNGWQRLFVVYLVFIHLPVTIGALWEAEPAALSKGLFAEQLNQRPPLKDLRVYNQWELLGRPDSKGDHSVGEIVEELVSRGLAYRFLIKAPRDSETYALIALKEMPEFERGKAVEFVTDLVNKRYWRDLSIKLAEALAYSIGIATLLYALGASTGWIFRGFFGKKS